MKLSGIATKWSVSRCSVKSQYFGDNKDLFTYDLILHIMQAGLVKHFTFVPMLTEPDRTGDGGKSNREKAKAGTQNKGLVDFLDKCIKDGKRDIKQLERFFKNKGIMMTIYDGEGYFSSANRHKYFSEIGNGLLDESLVFVDPDIGLEVKNSGKEHLLYSEVNGLYRRMDDSSILMIYQYLPRRPHLEYLNMRCEELKEKVTDDFPVCIDDNEIAFFFLTKNKELEHSLMHVISEYAERYGE